MGRYYQTNGDKADCNQTEFGGARDLIAVFGAFGWMFDIRKMSHARAGTPSVTCHKRNSMWWIQDEARREETTRRSKKLKSLKWWCLEASLRTRTTRRVSGSSRIHPAQRARRLAAPHTPAPPQNFKPWSGPSTDLKLATSKPSLKFNDDVQYTIERSRTLHLDTIAFNTRKRYRDLLVLRAIPDSPWHAAWRVLGGFDLLPLPLPGIDNNQSS